MVKKKSVKTMVGFVQAVANFWTGYFDFMGRATRSEYWFGVLFGIIVNAILWLIGNPTIYTVALIIIFTPFMSMTLRRFRDAGVSVWYYIVSMLIIFGMPFFQAGSWETLAQFGYASSGLILYSFFIFAFAIFKVVVACIPSRK